MVRRWNSQRRQEWEERLARFRASGLTVGRFCASENVSVNTYYYWAKRLGVRGGGRAGGGRQYLGSDPRPDMTAERLTPIKATRSSNEAKRAAEDAALVHFQWESGLRVSIPANCLDAIPCVVESARQATPERANAFQQILVDRR